MDTEDPPIGVLPTVVGIGSLKSRLEDMALADSRRQGADPENRVFPKKMIHEIK